VGGGGKKRKVSKRGHIKGKRVEKIVTKKDAVAVS